MKTENLLTDLNNWEKIMENENLTTRIEDKDIVLGKQVEL